MTQSQDAPQNPETAWEKVWTPETFSPPWDSNPIHFLEISLNFPYSSQEWNRIFEGLVNLLSHEDKRVWERAIDKLIRALEMEGSQCSVVDDYQPSPTEKRLESIFESVTSQMQHEIDLLAIFCFTIDSLAKTSHSKDDPYKQLVLAWLDQLASSEEYPALSQEEILAAQIFFGAYDSTWQAVGETLLDWLDHPNLNLRACAAHQIGEFCRKAFCCQEDNWESKHCKHHKPDDVQAVAGLPSLETMMQLIRDKEIERPGIAGAFFEVIPKEGFDAREWVFNVLEDSPVPEPCIPYFPYNLAYNADTMSTFDADAMRRLVDIGRADIARSAELETIWIASWEFAYKDRYLYPLGAALGYVELIDELPEVDLFLLFSNRKEKESPYAVVVVIYPKGKKQKLSRDVAQKWVDRIFPPEVRGGLRYDLPPIIPERGFIRLPYPCWYERGSVRYHQSVEDKACDRMDNATIGYRSELPWNPKEFL